MRIPSTSCLGTEHYQNPDGRGGDAEIITRRERGPSHSARRDVRSMGRPSLRRCVSPATEMVPGILDDIKGRQR